MTPSDLLYFVLIVVFPTVISVVLAVNFNSTLDYKVGRRTSDQVTKTLLSLTLKKRLAAVLIGGPIVWVWFPLMLLCVFLDSIFTRNNSIFVNWLNAKDVPKQTVEDLQRIIKENEEKVKEFERFKKDHPNHFKKV